MATLVLLHGGGLGPWSWETCRSRWRDAGHVTVAPVLPLDEAPLDDAANIAVCAVQRDSRDVVVIGHALGCALVPLVTARLQARAMVYVCGAVPEPGLSMAEQIDRDPSMVPMYRGAPFGSGASVTADDFVESLLHDCSSETRCWAEPRVRAAAQRRHRALESCATDRFPNDEWPSADVGAVAIIGVDDRALSPAWSRRATAIRLGVEPIELPGGHCPNIARPDELVAALAAVVNTPKS